MRIALIGMLASLAAGWVAAADPPRTLRLDYYHTGNTRQELFALDRIALEPLPWPGNPHKPVDDADLGGYSFEVIDPESKRVLFSRGFDSIFGEWVTTAEARSTNRTFHESLRFPAPAKPVQVVLKHRDTANVWRPVWSIAVDPNDRHVDRSVPPPPSDLIEIEKNGDPASKVDLLLLGDGYTAAQKDKFVADAKRMADQLFAVSPFRERRKNFNVWGLCPPAPQPGISRPSDGIHRANPLGSSYDIFGSERYVLTFDNRAFRRAAQFAPYDFVEILVNSPTYGGGGIYQLYGTVAVDSSWAAYVFIHEFGHHFAGLADEYYTASVAYLPPEKRFEPWRPNATALLAPDKLKWKDLVEPGTPIPTPWQKEEYERLSNEYQRQRTQLRKERRPESEFDALSRENKKLEDRLLHAEKHKGKVGAFEGAEYQAKGFYRPEVNCIMFTRTDFFCAVCRRAIDRVIDDYTKGP